MTAAVIKHDLMLGEEDDLYAQLWHTCAGSNIYVPRPGEKVFYFPQGHIEQVLFSLTFITCYLWFPYSVSLTLFLSSKTAKYELSSLGTLNDNSGKCGIESITLC